MLCPNIVTAGMGGPSGIVHARVFTIGNVDPSEYEMGGCISMPSLPEYISL